MQTPISLLIKTLL